MDVEASKAEQGEWQALDLVKLLGQLESEGAPLSAERQHALLAWEERLKDVQHPNLGAPYCPHCQMLQLSATDATAHIPRCERHPARVHYERLSRVARRVTGSNELEPVPGLTFDTESREQLYVDHLALPVALERLGRPGLTAEERHQAAEAVRSLLRWRINALERSADPCPWCGGVFALETFRDHLWSCERHPALERAAILSDTLKARFGEERLAVAIEEERFLQAGETLQALVRACRTYAQSMGSAGGGQYSTKVWTEKPWRFAVHLAQDFALEEARGPMRPELAALVTRIGTLAEQCLGFWNRMGDGDGGASLIDPQRCREWEAQVGVAEASPGAGSLAAAPSSTP